MIAVDAGVVISFLQGETNQAVERFALLLSTDQVVLAPSTVAELLSDPKGGPETMTLIGGLETLPLKPGYWARAGLLRASVRRVGRKAALGMLWPPRPDWMPRFRCSPATLTSGLSRRSPASSSRADAP
jgi:predicted nucleic acid-binding protein